MNQNKTTHSRLMVGLLLGVGLVIIFLSCNDGTFYTDLCEMVFSFLGYSGQEFPKSLVDHPEIGHALFYGLLTFLLLQFTTIPLSIIVASSFGGLLEYIQSYLPTRHAHINDFVADLLGIVLVVLLYSSFNFAKYYRKCP